MSTTAKQVKKSSVKKATTKKHKAGSYEAVLAAINEAEKNGLGDYVRNNKQNWKR